MIELVKLHLHETPYTAHEIAELCTVEDLKSVFIHEDVMQTSIQVKFNIKFIRIIEI